MRCKLFCVVLAVLCPGSATASDAPDAQSWFLRALSRYSWNEMDKWADPRVVTQEKLGDLAVECSKEDARKDITYGVLAGQEKGIFLDPGYSFGQLDDPLIEVLVYVRQTYEARRTALLEKDPNLSEGELDKACRVQILDLGAGHGLAMWKLVVAGAHVTGVEPQPTLLGQKVNVLWENLKKAEPFLPQGVKKSEVSRFVPTDAEKALGMSRFQKAFDGVYAARSLHYMTPVQARACAQKMDGVLKEGGKIWAIVHGGFFLDAGGQDKAVYDAQLAAQKPFPGYMMMNMKTVSNSGTTTKEKFFPLNESDPFPPTHLYPDFFKPGDKRSVSQKTAAMLRLIDKKNIQHQHRSVCLFDPKSLKSLFAGTPFEIDGLFWDAPMGLTPVETDEDTFDPEVHYGPKSLYLKATKQANNAQVDLTGID
ncbi:MAG: class I SAM-dependent methyltransferase [Proteobacteria bacterium]|nr:class I SAM-dependent methyltransferase [Pseudomonadota bacterium]